MGSMMVVALLISACGTQKATQNIYESDNDIISYSPVDTSKTVITLGKYAFFDSTLLEKAIEKKFKNVDIVPIQADAGNTTIAYLKLQANHDALSDIQIMARTVPANDYLYDMSSESYTSKYNLSSLNSTSINGKLYQLPLVNTLCGISYNKTLFKKHGWQVPTSMKEFYALCKKITKAGIRAFAPCLKYYSTVESVALGLSYDDMISTADKQVTLKAFLNHKRSGSGVIDPMMNVLRQLYKEGIIKESDFGSSATQLRYDMYNEKIAMMPSNLDVQSYAKLEKPKDEIGFMGYPSESGNKFQMIPGSRLSVSRKSMKDSKKKEAITQIMSYLSSSEGLDVVFKTFSGITSVKGYSNEQKGQYEEVKEALKNGNIYYFDYYGNNDLVNVFKNWTIGKASLAKTIEANDHAGTMDDSYLLNKPSIGVAKKDMSVLEVSTYMADKLKSKTKADIGLMLNNTFFKANISCLYKGKIVLPERFYLKGVADTDAVTTYGITGAHLKALMEHPYINGAEENVMYAFSGLKMTYAPWKNMNQNVEKLTLANGQPIDDNKVYTVAAWAGSIDAKYITRTIKSYRAFGNNMAFMTSNIKEDQTLSPYSDKRLTLDWKY